MFPEIERYKVWHYRSAKMVQKAVPDCLPTVCLQECYQETNAAFLSVASLRLNTCSLASTKWFAVKFRGHVL